MDEAWTAYTLAEELLKVMPSLGRLMASYMRDSGEEETTMMQVTVLFHLEHQTLTASELAKKRRVSLQAASVLVQGLVEKGWVLRVPDPKDRRQFLLQLTPEGLERAHSARKQVANFLAEFMQGLSEEELAAAKIFLPALNQLLLQQVETEASKTEKQGLISEEQTNL
jgi:DNA-binding MarR family transcriptional regulator